MATYCYSKTEGGEVFEYRFPMGEAPWTITMDDGEQVHRNISAEQSGRRHMPGNWPMKSDAMGCHPSQVKEYQQKLAEKGLQADFTKDGRIILNSPKHRKAIGEAMKFYDKNGGYSDPQRA